MVRIKRPTRSMASRRVSKDNDPSICLTAVKSEVEQHGIENAHASNGTNHNLEERCSEHCLSTSDGYPVVELDDNKNIATDQPSKPCDRDTKIITSNPDSTTLNNVSTYVKLESSEYRRKGSLFAVKPLTTYYRRKGLFRSVNPFKTYRRRRPGYMSFGISPLPIQNSIEIEVEIDDVNTTLEQSMELDPSEKSDIIVDKKCDVLSDRNNLSKSTNYMKNDVRSGITSYTELVERKQDDAEEASFVPSETMKQQIISQPGRADEKLLPEQSPSCSMKRKLLVLDINGLLADIVPIARVSHEYKPDLDTIIAGKAVFKRPFCDEFLEFCFERFNVGVWSSRTKKNVDSVLNFIMGEKKRNLLFCWDQSHCTGTRYFTPDNDDKPLLLKKLSKLWENSETDLPWKSGDHDDSDTLLLDDSPYKALLNPPNTAIFPQTYQYSNEKDSSLGPDGDLRIYLEGLSMAPNVQEYVKHNPYGQNPITEKHASWSFYHEVIASTVVGSLRKPYQSSVSSEKLRNDVYQVNDTTVVAETSKKFLGSNGAFQHEKGISIGSPCSTQRGCKRGRSQSPRHDISKRQSHSLSPKKCRSRSPAPLHGSDFGGDKTTNYQTLRPEYRNFPQGRFLRGATCRFEHHQSHSCHQSYADKGVQDHESQIFKPQLAPRECYNFIQGKCKLGESCRFSHSLAGTTDLGTQANERHRKLCDAIRRDKAVPRECRDFVQGKCTRGASCRFNHSIPEKTDLAMEGTVTRDKQCDDIRRDKAVPRECRDFVQGKCSRGASCWFNHSLLEKADLGTEGKETGDKNCDIIRSGKALPRECRNFLQGKCSWGASCQVQHSVPGKNDIGTGGHETPDKQCHNIRRENAVQRECTDFTRGECNYGTSCRYLHSVPEKSDISFHNRYYQDVTSSSKISDDCEKDQNSSFDEHGKQCSDIRRDKAVPRECYDFIRGKCNRGANCPFQHSLPGKTDLGTEGKETDYKKCDDFRSDKAFPRECRDFHQGKSSWGASCRFQHSVPDKNVIGTGYETPDKQFHNIRRENFVQQECNDFIQGKCNYGTSCRYLHSVPEKTGISFHNRYYKDVTPSSKISDDRGKDQSSSSNEHGRYKAVAEVCRNYSQGRCYRGPHCRRRHQELGLPVGLRSTTSQPGDTSRFKAVREVCRKYTWGRCQNEFNCRYLHQEPNLTGPEFTSQVVDMSRYKAMPEVCRNYSQGRCHEGSDCRFQHSEPFMSVGLGSTSQHGETSRFSTVSEVCRNYTKGRCLKGSECRYLHPEQSSTFRMGSTAEPDCQYQHRESGLTFRSGSTSQFRKASRFIAPLEVCNNYTLGRYGHPEPGACMSPWPKKDLPHQTTSSNMRWNTKTFPRQCVEYTRGKCSTGVHFRYSHHESDQCGSSRIYRSHQQDGDVPLKLKNFGSFGDTGSICHETSVHEHTESRTQELIPDFSVVDGNRGTVEALPNQHIDSERFQKDNIVPDDDANDIKHLESDVRVSIGNLEDSGLMILDADNSCHETSVHEDTESGAKELIPNFPVIEEKRGTIEALHSHPIDINSLEKASVVPDDDTKDKKVIDNVVCA